MNQQENDKNSKQNKKFQFIYTQNVTQCLPIWLGI